MRRTDCCWVILSYSTLCWFFCNTIISVSDAVDTLAVGQVMRDWDYLESPNKRYRLRFSSPEGSTSRYLGIQHMGVYPWIGVRIPMLVWVANRDKPIADTSGTLSISHDENLVLSNYSGNFYTILNAQHPAISSSNTSLTLLNTGNLVLRAAGKHIVWQSFDYPSDTWLPGMKLGLFKSSTGQLQNRFLTSWLSDQVPSMGAFTFGVDPNNTKQLVIWKRGVVYWRSGMWNGYNFTYFAQSYYIQFNFSYFSTEGQSYFTFTVNENKHSYWIDLRSVGIIGAVGIKEFGSSPDISDAPVFCNPGQARFGLINQGCVVPEPSNCTTGDTFIKTTGYIISKSPLFFKSNDSLGISDCEDICRPHCSCIAYISEQSECYFYGDTDKSSYSGNILYIRAGFMVQKGNAKKRQLWLAIGGSVVFLVVTFLLYLWWKNPHFRGNNGRSKDETSQDTELLLYEQTTEAAIIDDHELILFTLRSIEIATDYFSDANKLGQGGFGSVYKGKLVNGEEIAVKRLSISTGEGLREFKNEVILISRIQHRNLVRLLGYCSQGDERILIYEYLKNKSLDSFIFDKARRTLLDWKMRVNIIEGIAQGLQYLHKYSRLRIIHRDLKTSNILLDDNMNPKISDFGTARIFGDNEAQANTKRIVGTYGYMSPEYALDGLFSVKSDVFSFGVMMLEIISGKKNTGFYQPDRVLNLLGYAWDMWNEGRGLEIMDEVLVETCTSEVLRYIEVGFLCVQESAIDRPTISEVLSMLSNERSAIPTPKQPAFSAIIGVNDANRLEIPMPCSINDVTISEVKGR
ncbi:G-type lectin S-receptor-like serine/threonine-protein kinase [Camellia lanceoleosa]|uniref:G-type lectin S-receptor-like serine/threonine-protein kinase n=1 Tax=Camellia lanceoleosa TaxID=1840588 RepID=A0ACC0FG50_9ERIC|nr:G-type lectin S-receptor-like serine/threonine-protein kinase [Camellia lanceoleosa]